MKSMIGLVSKVKILKFSERPLVYFKLDNQSCLIAGHSLNFLADVEDGMHVVVKKYAVIGETKMMMEFNRIAI